MLIRNVYTDEGLVNGAQGSVEGIEWGDDHDTMPRGIYVKFDNPSIGRSLRNPTDHLYSEAILIRPITANFYGVGVRVIFEEMTPLLWVCFIRVR